MAVPNPILPGCFPDPSICRVGEWHYLVASTFELLPGMPREVLEEISGQTELLVVGTRGLGAVMGVLLGSVSQHLVAHAACPVVVVR